MLLANIFDSRVVNNQGKDDWTGMTGPQGGGAFGRSIAVFGKVHLEPLVGSDASLLQARHPLLNLDINPFVAGQIGGRAYWSMILAGIICRGRCMYLYWAMEVL
jgi:hypothetical protein